MPRMPRVFMSYACYHVITRGNQKQIIFKDTDDFCNYLKMLKKALRENNILIYSYCLMPNHTHLLIEPKCLSDMSNCMHWLNRGYTAYFNAKYEKVGHLWQGRFKSKPIIKGRYLINCANYIEENPVRAGIVSDPSDYRWSSYRERCLLYDKTLLDDIIINQTQEDRAGTGLISNLGTL